MALPPPTTAGIKVSALASPLRFETPLDLFLFGPPDSGKTYAACVNARSWHPSPEFVTLADLVTEFQAALTGRSTETADKVVARYQRFPVLILDDISAVKLDDRVSALVLQIVSNRFDASVPTVVTSNLSPDDAAISGALRSRFQGYRVVGCRYRGDRAKRAGEIARPSFQDDPLYRPPKWLAWAAPAVRYWCQSMDAPARMRAFEAALRNGMTQADNPDLCLTVGWDRNGNILRPPVTTARDGEGSLLDKLVNRPEATGPRLWNHAHAILTVMEYGAVSP